MDEQLAVDAEELFKFVGHKFDNNPMIPVVFKDTITASDRSDGMFLFTLNSKPLFYQIVLRSFVWNAARSG